LEAQENNIDNILAERGQDYGEFKDIANFTLLTYDHLVSLDIWKKSTPAMKESAHMILQKLARAFNGNPNKKDTWDDIAGYATLVSKTLK
jgi:hypothetical bacteriophage protein